MTFSIGDIVEIIPSDIGFGGCEPMEKYNGQIGKIVHFSIKTQSHFVIQLNDGSNTQCLPYTQLKLLKRCNNTSDTIYYEWPNIAFNSYTPYTDMFYKSLAENKPKKTMIQRLSTAVKKFLSADLQTQIKAGFRYDGNLELTEQGKIAAIEALLDATPTAQTAFTVAAAEIVAECENNK